MSCFSFFTTKMNTLPSASHVSRPTVSSLLSRSARGERSCPCAEDLPTPIAQVISKRSCHEILLGIVATIATNASDIACQERASGGSGGVRNAPQGGNRGISPTGGPCDLAFSRPVAWALTAHHERSTQQDLRSPSGSRRCAPTGQRVRPYPDQPCAVHSFGGIRTDGDLLSVSFFQNVQHFVHGNPLSDHRCSFLFE